MSNIQNSLPSTDISSNPYRDSNFLFTSKLLHDELNRGANVWWIMISSVLFSIFNFLISALIINSDKKDTEKCSVKSEKKKGIFY